MTALEAAQHVVALQAAQRTRQRDRDRTQYDVRNASTGEHRGWFILDVLSASAIVALDRDLDEAARHSFRRMSLPTMASIAIQRAHPNLQAK